MYSAETTRVVSNKIKPFGVLLSKKNYRASVLQYALRNILSTAQIFGILPIKGVRGEVYHLEFKWVHPRTIFAIFVAVLVGLYSFFIFCDNVLHQKNFINFVPVMWNCRAFFGLLFYLEAATKWQAFMEDFNRMELALINSGPLPNISLRFKLIAATFVSLGMIQHIAHIVTNVQESLENANGSNAFEKYYYTMFPVFFDYFEFSYFITIVLEFILLTTRFFWQFNDVFIIILSNAIALRFQQLNYRLKHTQDKSNKFWRQLRLEYARLSLLSDKFNDCFAKLVMVSFAGNLYLTATLLYDNLQPREGILKHFYQYYSGFYIGFHIIMVTMYSSWVYEESYVPMRYLLDVQTEDYSQEIERFIHNIDSHRTAVSAGNIFEVHRSIILKIASAVVALQLILIQFDVSSEYNKHK